MEYVIGVALFAAAFVLVGFARRFYAQANLPRWASGFGSGEFAALVVVMLITGGLGAFISRAASDFSDGNYLILASAVAGVFATAYAIRYLFGGGRPAVAAMAIDGAGIEGISVLPAGEPAAPVNANRKQKKPKRKAAA